MHSLLRRSSLVLAVLALAALSMSATATAAVPTVNACYKTTGKKRGLMRVVAPGKACKAAKGEKRVTWNVAGPAGARGPVGPGGSTDQLTTIVQAQANQITALTQQLTDVTGTLDGVCTQVGAVTNQANLLRTSLGGVSLNGVLTALGGLLNVPSLPSALAPFNC